MLLGNVEVNRKVYGRGSERQCGKNDVSTAPAREDRFYSEFLLMVSSYPSFSSSSFFPSPFTPALSPQSPIPASLSLSPTP